MSPDQVAIDWNDIDSDKNNGLNYIEFSIDEHGPLIDVDDWCILKKIKYCNTPEFAEIVLLRVRIEGLYKKPPK